jgi:hypothetical protein
MPRDAFGRDKDEDPLAAMGWRQPRATTPAGSPRAAPPRGATRAAAAIAPAPPATIAPAAPRGATPPAAPRASRPARPGARRPRGLVRLITLVAILAWVGGNFARTDKTGVDGGGRGPTPQVQAVGGSLFEARALASAVARVRPEGRLRRLRVLGDRIQAEVAPPDGGTVTIRVRNDGAFVRSASPRSAGRLVPWSAVDPAAPRRILRTVGTTADHVIDAVLADVGAGPRWSVLVADGSRYSAGPHGRRVQPG